MTWKMPQLDWAALDRTARSSPARQRPPMAALDAQECPRTIRAVRAVKTAGQQELSLLSVDGDLSSSLKTDFLIVDDK
jgi:hypothetical protein